jgi:hypothetical protein
MIINIDPIGLGRYFMIHANVIRTWIYMQMLSELGYTPVQTIKDK